MIKKSLFAVVLAVFTMSTAQAGQINGSQAFGGGVSGTNSLNGSSSVSILGLQIGAFDARTGDYVGDIGGLIGGNGVLNFALGSAYSYGSAQFGTFTGTVALDDNTALNSRTVYLQGSFTAGTDPKFVGKTDPTSATVILSFTQANGAGNAISLSGTQVTPAIATPHVPEPATILALASGLAFAGFAGLRSRKAAK